MNAFTIISTLVVAANPRCESDMDDQENIIKNSHQSIQDTEDESDVTHTKCTSSIGIAGKSTAPSHKRPIKESGHSLDINEKGEPKELCMANEKTLTKDFVGPRDLPCSDLSKDLDELYVEADAQIDNSEERLSPIIYNSPKRLTDTYVTSSSALRTGLFKGSDELYVYDNAHIGNSEDTVPLPPSIDIPTRGLADSYGTLSADDMTLDAEMGRPPRITTAGLLLRLQQEDEQERREKTRRKQEMKDGELKNASVPDTVMGGESRQTKDRGTTQNKTSQDVDKEQLEMLIRQLAKTHSQPKQIVKNYDAAVVYEKADYDEVTDFVITLRTLALQELSEDIRIELFDSEEFAQSKVAVVSDVVERCSVVFVYLTPSCNTDFVQMFCEEAVGLSRLGMNNPGVASGLVLNDRKWVIKPVHTKPSRDRFYKTPIGLLTLNGLDWYDWPSAFVKDRAKSILKTAVARRKSREKEMETTINYRRTFNDDIKMPNSLEPRQRTAQSSLQDHSIDVLSSVPIQSARPMINMHSLIQQQQQSARVRQGNQVRHPQVDTYVQHIPLQQHQIQTRHNYNQTQFVPRQHFPPHYNMYGYRHPYVQPQHIPGIQTHPQHHLHEIAPMSYHTSIPINVMYQQMEPSIRTPPPNYASNPMQDNLSLNSYFYQREHQRSHPQGMHQDPRYNQVPQEPNPGACSSRSDVAYGSLMRDKSHDTPSLDQLQVVSRVTGKLVTNTNLSNDDLEIDTNEKPHSEAEEGIDKNKKPEFEADKYKHTDTDEQEHPDESTDESDSDSDGLEHGITSLFPADGKVVNILGSAGVVQIGKGNTTVKQIKSSRRQKLKTRGMHQSMGKVPIMLPTGSSSGQQDDLIPERKVPKDGTIASGTNKGDDIHCADMIGHSMDMRPSYFSDPPETWTPIKEPRRDNKQPEDRSQITMAEFTTVSTNKKNKTEEDFSDNHANRLKGSDDDLEELERHHSIEDNTVINEAERDRITTVPSSSSLPRPSATSTSPSGFHGKGTSQSIPASFTFSTYTPSMFCTRLKQQLDLKGDKFDPSIGPFGELKSGPRTPTYNAAARSDNKIHDYKVTDLILSAPFCKGTSGDDDID